MKRLYKFKAEGIWFSKNGHAAYLRGEKPSFLWKDNESLTPTVRHHIAIRKGRLDQYARPLVMFYKEDDK